MSSSVLHSRVQPPLSISATEVDLGDAAPGSKVWGTVVVSNHSNRAIEFDVGSTCGCTQVEPRQGELPSYGSATIAVTLSLPAHCGSRQEGTIFVTTSDSELPRLSCTFHSACTPAFRCESTHVDFGESGRTASGAIEVRKLPLIPGPGGKGKTPVLLRPPRLECFAAQIIHEEKGSLLHISFTAPDRPGVYNDSLAIAAADDSDNRVFELPITAKVLDPFMMIPSSVRMRRASDSSSFQSTVMIAIYSDGSADRELQLRDSPEGWTLSNLGALGKNRSRLQFTCSESAVTALQSTALRLKLFDVRSGMEQWITVALEDDALR